MNSNKNLTVRNPPEVFEKLWSAGSTIPDVFEFLRDHAHATYGEKLKICEIDQTRRWQTGQFLPAEQYIKELQSLGLSLQQCVPVVIAEYKLRASSPDKMSAREFHSRFPELSEVLPTILTGSPLQNGTNRGNKEPTCAGTGEFVDKPVNNRQDKPRGDGRVEPVNFNLIGRYRTIRVLGDGGFGRVYLAHDDELVRDVAVKVPHPGRIVKSSDVDEYLNEARIVAKLDHIAIVPIYDCGRTGDGHCFAVSKFIDGCNLAERMKRNPLTFAATAKLLQQVADGLHYAHVHKVVHRDIKPGNILIDRQDRPYIADFGIALKDEDYGKGPTIIGTFPYMSPEQLRGEGHLVDGRSDIFSLGVTMYEMLTRQRPFPANRTKHDLTLVPRPPRQIDDTIPKELERICLKALEPRVADRYFTALDLSDDLRYFLEHSTDPSVHQAPARHSRTDDFNDVAQRKSSEVPLPVSWVPIIPKGLRSFDKDDAGFFLELVPGARDREGIPESVLFWKRRIEETDPDQTFRIGLIYAPSGCGKSSFIKAGLLPRLARNVTSIYVECTLHETESRLLRAIRKSFPGLPGDLGLVDSLSLIRRGQVLPKGHKLFVVLDQFEQYLHAHGTNDWNDLLLALRQTDGEYFQCVLGVRDDFWMAVTRFMDELEVPFVVGDNVSSIGLLSRTHAEKVLTAIGQAYSAIPSEQREITAAQKQFISIAVDALTQGDHVIPVHLSLFAEMIKDKRWTPATIDELGGLSGIGVTFLEETFNGISASPQHRRHQYAARKVLGALLSDESSEIKGSMRSHDELLDASGYKETPRDFENLIVMLDSELRLITPTDPEGMETGDLSTRSQATERQKYYHLTHDYLVPSLHDWLTRKQQETRRGRAELLLGERAKSWHVLQESRRLPGLLEWFRILLLVPRRIRSSTAEQRELLKASSKYYSRRITLFVVILAVAIGGAWDSIHRLRAVSLVQALPRTKTENVPEIVQQIDDYRFWANPPLLRRLVEADPDSMAAVHWALALERFNPQQQQIIVNGLYKVTPEGVGTICDALAEKGDPKSAAEALWANFLDEKLSDAQRFRAALALSVMDFPATGRKEHDRNKVFAFLPGQLIEEIKLNRRAFGPWLSLLQPVRDPLHDNLYVIFANRDLETESIEAAAILGELFADSPSRLCELLIESNPAQYRSLAPYLESGKRPPGLESELLIEFNRPIPELKFDEETTNRDKPSYANSSKQEAISNYQQVRLPEHLRLTRRKAFAAVALMDCGQVDPLRKTLAETENPDLQSYLEDRLSQLATRPDVLAKLIPQEVNSKAKAAMIRSLAGISPNRITAEFRDQLQQIMVSFYENDPDSGIHSAAEWFLRRHGFEQQIDRFLSSSAPKEPSETRSWYINPAGETMVVFSGPITTTTGSHEYEPGHESNEERVNREIPRSYAISTTEVSLKDYLKFKPDFRHKDSPSMPTGDSPVVIVTWDWAALYCNDLSKKAGLLPDQWCYQNIDGKVVAFPDSLTRTGYRLPTEAEWEHACRAETETAYSWGNNLDVMDRYATTINNSDNVNWPSTRTCPNSAGMFSMLGNVAEMIHGKYISNLIEYPEDIDYTANGEDAQEVRRGGHALSFPHQIRHANRSESGVSPGTSARVGFRVARTVP